MESTARILVVEDDEHLLGLMQRILAGAGYGAVRGLTDPRQALPVFREWQPALVVMDVQMPYMDGIAVMQQLRVRSSPDEVVPFLIVTGDAAAETRERALSAGASDFLTKPFDHVEVVLRVRNLLALRHVQRQLHDALERSEAQVRRVEAEMVRRLTHAAKYSDAMSQAEPMAVGELAAAIAAAMGLSAQEIDRIRLATPLHDIGMIGVRPELLQKEGSLSLEELDEIRAHTTIGAEILGSSESPLLQLAEEIALYHHEAWDGSGYTPGLSGENIPLAARIVAVADTFYSMTEHRPYQDAVSTEAAIEWIRGQAGRRFDPRVVDAFVSACAMYDLPLLNERRGSS